MGSASLGPYVADKGFEGAENHERDADHEAEHEEKDAAFRRRGNGDHVVGAHDEVGDEDGLDGAPKVRARLDALKNGDRLSGSIIKLGGKTLMMKTDMRTTLMRATRR